MLASILLFPSFGNIFLFAKFEIQQDEIAKTICVQRKIDNNTCNGKCALRTSLQKFDENEQKSDCVLKEKIELIYLKPFFENNFTVTFDSELSKLMVFHTSKKTISISKSTFRPPTYFI